MRRALSSLLLAALLALPAAAEEPASVALTAAPSPGQIGKSSTFRAVVGPKFDMSDGGMGKVAAGFGHTCAVTTAGGAACWGSNDWGQLGIGTTDDKLLPSLVVGLDGTGALSGVKALVGGEYHSCALLSEGKVACWGYNGDGELGLGVLTGDKLEPVLVPGLDGVTAIAGGGWHNCVLRADGTVWCWGWGAKGQIGNGKKEVTEPTPVQVDGLTDVTAIASGEFHTCAILSDRSVRCWGENTDGQLGNGTMGGQMSTPVTVVDGGGPLADVVDIAVGSRHTCAVLVSRDLRCWGANNRGQLGDGTSSGSASVVSVKAPVGVGALANVSMVTAGSEHSCARLQSGEALCWGANEFGQIGDGARLDRLIPKSVGGQKFLVVAASAVSRHSCGLSADGMLSCWGDNEVGQIGNGIASLVLAPVSVSGLDAVTAMSAGERLTCVLVSGGAVRCSGANEFGQLGNGGAGRDSAVPVAVKTAAGSAAQLLGATQIAVGPYHNCALLPSAGEVRCWGYNSDGQLGDGGTQDRAVASTPVAFPAGPQPATRISAGGYHSCAVVAGGVWCWGSNEVGQLGTGDKTSSPTPVKVQGLDGDTVTDVGAGYDHTCALLSTGAVKCWGDNNVGQLGDGTTTQRLTATSVAILGGAIKAATLTYSGRHTCAKLQSEVLVCWGYNGAGQIGDGTTTNRLQPTYVKGVGGIGFLSGVSDTSAGYYHTCAIVAGKATCWGDNYQGQLGNGGTAQSLTPVPVLAADGNPLAATAVAAGGFHSCALSGTTVSCWGKRTYGQLGDGKFGYAPTPDTVGPDATGTISFRLKGKTIGTAALAGGVATLKKRLPANLHRITAVFKGDATYLAATSPVLKHLVTGTPGKDTLRGGKAGDVLHGSSGNDRILGRGGNDSLNGGEGRDRIEGGPGRDRLAGGPGRDVFVFRSAADSRPGKPDTITDFARGDRIDVSAFAGNGTVRFRRSKSRLEVDVDRDGKADFAVVLKGVKRLPRAAVRK